MAPRQDPGPPRYSERPFPSYRYVPGLAPHPTRDPDGHSYRRAGEQPAAFDPPHWDACEAYLYGIDLFNHGYWWEAHEALEAVWVAAGRRSRAGLFLQGLIQIAVAHLKEFQGLREVSERMAAQGLDKMKRLKGVYLGIDVPAFRLAVHSHFSGHGERTVLIKLIRDAKAAAESE